QEAALHRSSDRCGPHRARSRDLPRRALRPCAPLAVAPALAGRSLDARARAREVPPLPAALRGASLPSAVRLAARDAAHPVGRPATRELVLPVPRDPHANGLASAKARRALAAQ